ESSTITSPPGEVWATAAAKLRQGDVREQGLASLPLPAEMNVRWASAVALWAAVGERPEANEPAASAPPAATSTAAETATSRGREMGIVTLPSCLDRGRPSVGRPRAAIA